MEFWTEVRRQALVEGLSKRAAVKRFDISLAHYCTNNSKKDYNSNFSDDKDLWNITLMDKMVGDRLRELDEHGLADDTIIFFYSDHGGMLSRSKRYIYNVGTQVPLIVSFPKKWQHLAPAKPGTASDRLVSFIDLPQTILSLAGTEIPDQMQL